MEKRTLILLLPLIFVTSFVYAQLSIEDSLWRRLAQTTNDSSKVTRLTQMAAKYQFFESDSAILFANQAIDLAQKIHFSKGKIRALIRLGEVFRLRGEYPQALEAELKALQLSKEHDDTEGEALSLFFTAAIYIDLGDYQKGLNALFQAKRKYDKVEPNTSSFGLSNIGNAYDRLNRLDSALYFQRQAFATASLIPKSTVTSLSATRLGMLQERIGNNDSAFYFYRVSLLHTDTNNDILNRGLAQLRLATLFHKLQQTDSSFYYARLSLENLQQVSSRGRLLEAVTLLAELYKERRKIDSALHYQELAMALKDSLFGAEKFRKLQLLAINEQLQQQQIAIDEQQYRNEVRMYALIGGLMTMLVIAGLLWRNNRQKQKANTLLQQQKQQTENAYQQLKSTQAQLIQKEKMASLGELTAGVAHEIQNPLNFVNNFSDVTLELADDLKREAAKGKYDEVMSIAEDIANNLHKVAHHGRRADAIIKSMMEHSRSSQSEKQPTDINALAEEYLKLAYHGFRVKNNSFDVILETHYDPSVGKVSIRPQDIGRVLLNLFNNAFYSVQQKKKELKGTFEPIIQVSTRRTANKIEVSVKDNGVGIPEKIAEKIYQPFFTTKPTGEGTGLGLSLSYDIITKGHSGEIKVNSKEGEGAEFIVRLPALQA